MICPCEIADTLSMTQTRNDGQIWCAFLSNQEIFLNIVIPDNYVSDIQ